MLMNEFFDEVCAGCLAIFCLLQWATKTDMFLSSGYRGATAGVTGVLQCQSGSSLDLQSWGKCNFFGGGYSCKTKEVCVSVEMGHSGSTVITVIGQGSACPMFPVVHQFPMVAQW